MTIPVTIIDQNDNPVSNIEIEIMNLENSRPITLYENYTAQSETGIYIILTSLNIENDEVKNGDEIEVTGLINDVIFIQRYGVIADKCHPKVVIGPDTLRVELPE